jgi:hypothetical protein
VGLTSNRYLCVSLNNVGKLTQKPENFALFLFAVLFSLLVVNKLGYFFGKFISLVFLASKSNLFPKKARCQTLACQRDKAMGTVSFCTCGYSLRSDI